MFVAIGVSSLATVNLIEAHNAHRIPGQSGGVPNVTASRTEATAHPLAASVPSVKDAFQAFSAAGGNLTLDSTFGADPLRDNLSAQKERQRRLAVHCLPMEEIFSDVLSGNTDSLGDAIQFLIAVTEEWASA